MDSMDYVPHFLCLLFNPGHPLDHFYALQRYPARGSYLSLSVHPNGQILRVIFSLRRTESPMKIPPQFKHPTHGSKVKSDKKLRREQRRRDKHAKKADKPPP